MRNVLEMVQSDYRALLLHGIVPTGLVVTLDDLSDIQAAAASDQRIIWDQTGAVERVFGFAPTVAAVQRSRFTSPSHPWPDYSERRSFTLNEMRSL